jgi:kynurenine formamidase
MLNRRKFSKLILGSGLLAYDNFLRAGGAVIDRGQHLRGVLNVNVSTEPEHPEVIRKNDFDKLMKSLSNWGRWGKDDQLGALNLITPEKRKQAAGLVISGICISLSRNMSTEKVGSSLPFEQRMLTTGLTPEADNPSGSATDTFSFNYHGRALTHFDALCHMFWEGRMYNGYPQQDVTDKGAGKLSVINAKNGIFTRGVLMDFAWLFGSKYLKGRAIYSEDLDAWEKKTGVRIQSGDAVLIRTGRWARLEAEGEWDTRKELAGLNVSSMPWFRERDIALLGSDVISDVNPSGVEDVRVPVHKAAICAMGVPLIDNCDLEALGEYAAVHSRWDFLFTVTPLAIGGGTGSPVNPTAIF